MTVDTYTFDQADAFALADYLETVPEEAYDDFRDSVVAVHKDKAFP